MLTAKYPPKAKRVMEEVYVAFKCTAKLYFRGPQRPVEHRCRLTLGATRQQKPGSTCVLTIEGEACQRRTFKVSVVSRHFYTTIYCFLVICYEITSVGIRLQ